VKLRGITLSARPVLALDVGGTHVRTAVVFDDGARTFVARSRTPVAGGPAAILDACQAALEETRAGVAPDIGSQILGIGISSPGPVDPWRGVVVQTPNMGPGFANVPLAPELERRLGLPAFLERDTNVAALGEMAFGAARDCPDFVYLTVSTGVGGAIVSEGRIFHGPDGTAGELGHMPVAMEGICGCGATGHLEAFLGGAAMAKVARAEVAAGVSPFLQARAAEKGLESIEALDIAQGEDAGDEVCRQIMERGRRAFAIACVGYVDALNPTRIVVGGAIADAQGDRLLGPARAEVAATAFRTPRSRVQIVPAELGADVGLAGAHPLVIARLGDPAWRRGRLDSGAVGPTTL
jgi:glucokinase